MTMSEETIIKIAEYVAIVFMFAIVAWVMKK